MENHELLLEGLLAFLEVVEDFLEFRLEFFELVFLDLLKVDQLFLVDLSHLLNGFNFLV